MFFGKEAKETPRGRARVPGASSQGGLIFSSSGLTPRSRHPGEETLPHPHVATQARESQEHREAFEYCYEHHPTTVPGDTATPPTIAPAGGVRHHDAYPSASVETYHGGRSSHPFGVQQSKGSLLPGSNSPRLTGAASGPVNRPGYRMHAGATAAECSEAILRRFLQDPEPIYRDAAKEALETIHDPSALVEAEKRISHHKASRTFAEESAARRAALSHVVPSRLERESAPYTTSSPSCVRGNGMGGRSREQEMEEMGGRMGQAEDGSRVVPRASPLGAMGARLAQSTPFALSDDKPPDRIVIPKPASRFNNVTGNPLPRANYSSPSLLAHMGGGGSGGHAREGEEGLPSSPPVQIIPAPFTRAPYDSIPATEEVQGRYPAPPPVGVRTGMWNKPLLVHHVNPGSVHQSTPDQDTINFRKAEHARQLHETADLPQNTSVGHTVICGSSMDGCEENLSDFNRKYNPQSTNQNPRYATAASLMEERCRARERELETRRVGKKVHPARPTSLW